MKTMRALRFAVYGPPSVLSLQDVPIPEPKPGETLVEILASGINPSDVKFVSGAMSPSLPRTPGRDFAGVVVGGDMLKGREVWGSGAGFGVTRDGAHAQYVLVPSDWLSVKPGNLSMEQAAAVGVPYVTAWTALVRAANVQAGETVLITGASGAVGRAAIRIAHWQKAKVIGAARSVQPSESDAFINTSDHDLPTEVRALTNGKGADVVFDTVGGPMFEPALKSLGLGGRQVAITSVGNRRVEFDLADFYHSRLRLIGVDTAQLSGADIAEIMNELRVGFEHGSLGLPTVKTWPLGDAVAAYEDVARGDTSAKQILLPHVNFGTS